MVKPVPPESASIHDEQDIHQLPAAEYLDAYIELTQPYLDKSTTLPSVEEIDFLIKGAERFAQIYAVQSKSSTNTRALFWMGAAAEVMLPNIIDLLSERQKHLIHRIIDLNGSLANKSDKEQNAIREKMKAVEEDMSYSEMMKMSATAVHRYFRTLTSVHD